MYYFAYLAFRPQTILNLGPELIVLVFSHLRIRDLCKVALVCRQFKELAYSKRLWQHAELILPLMRGIDPDVVPSLLQKGIRRFAIQAYTQRELLENIRFFPVLDSLSLALLSEAFDFGEWKLLDGLHLTMLKFLELEFIDTRYIIDESLAALAAKCPNLEELSCSTNFFPFPKEGLTSKGLHAFFDQMKKLKVLTLQFRKVPLDHSSFDLYSDSVQVLSLGIENLDTIAMKTIGCAFPKLRKLNFTECDYVGGSIVDECALHLGHLPRLTFDRDRKSVV